MTIPIFAHIDANSFYCSCHILFEPALEQVPVVVLANNDSYVISRNPAAKAMGIQMATPTFRLRSLIHEGQLKAFSSMYPLYADMSRRFFDTVASLFPEVEPYSIDELFVDFSFVPTGERRHVAHILQKRVRVHTGLPVAIGVGASKALAKLANKRAKLDSLTGGILDLTDPTVNLKDILAGTMVDDLWGIGRRRAQVLHHAGVHTALQFSQASDTWLRRTLHVPVLRLAYEVRGQSVLPLSLVPPPPKSLVRARSFGRPVTERGELQDALIVYLSRAAEHLRAQQRAATVLSVFLSTNHFRKKEPHYSNSCVIHLSQPTSSTLELIHLASQGLSRIYHSGYAYQRVGVMLLGLVPHSPLQLSFFEIAANVDKQRRLMEALDTVNRRFGRDTVTVGIVEKVQSWQRRMTYASPLYTTRWEELPVVWAT